MNNIYLFTITYTNIYFVFPISALQGASNGLLLWFNKVLPTLLPFIILSNILIKLDILKSIPSFTYGLILGFLTGLPMGAKTSSDLLENNKINYKEASFLLSICNNPSPMFIINYQKKM